MIRITNYSVCDGNEDYWVRLGAILKENQDLGISNEIYRNLQLPTSNNAFFKQLIQPKQVYQKLI